MQNNKKDNLYINYLAEQDIESHWNCMTHSRASLYIYKVCTHVYKYLCLYGCYLVIKAVCMPKKFEILNSEVKQS